MNQLPRLLLQRRTVRRLRDEPVPRDLLEFLISAACLAPSAHNSQPWRFVIIEMAAMRANLARAMGEAFGRDLAGEGLPAEAVKERVDASVHRLVAAPVLVIACLEPADLQQYPDAVRQSAEHIMGVQSVAAAIQNLLLAATDAGLGAGWMCAPLFCQNVVSEVLELPAAWEPQALITVGWPAESPGERAQAPLASRLVYR